MLLLSTHESFGIELRNMSSIKISDNEIIIDDKIIFSLDDFDMALDFDPIKISFSQYIDDKYIEILSEDKSNYHKYIRSIQEIHGYPDNHEIYSKENYIKEITMKSSNYCDTIYNSIKPELSIFSEYNIIKQKKKEVLQYVFSLILSIYNNTNNGIAIIYFDRLLKEYRIRILNKSDNLNDILSIDDYKLYGILDCFHDTMYYLKNHIICI